MSAVLIWIIAQTAAAVSMQPTDERVEYLAGSGHLLSGPSIDAVLNDPALRGDLKRVGLARGCATLFRVKREVFAHHYPTFRPLMIAAMRSVVPSERLASQSALGWGSVAMIRFQRPIREELQRTAAPIFLATAEEMRREFRNANSQQVDEWEGEAPAFLGRVDFDRPAQVNFACMNYMSTSRSEGGGAEDRGVKR